MAVEFPVAQRWPHCSFLDFAMGRDAGDLVQRRIDPNTMGSSLAIPSATMLAPRAFQLREFHASAISKPRARRGGKGLFPQARSGTAAPILARPQDSLWPLRWLRLAKSRQESPPQSRYNPLFGGFINGCQFHAFRLSQPPVSVHFSSSRPTNPANPSCQACVIMPGRKLFRVSARIPNSKPYTAIRIADLPP